MNKIIINFGGKEREFRLGIGFIISFLKAHNLELSDVDKKLVENVYFWQSELMFHSLKYAIERKQGIVDFTIDDIYDWIDECGGVLSEKSVYFYQSYVKSLVQNVPQNEQDDKKKVNQ